MKSARWFISYVLMAGLGLWGAFALSSYFMAPAHSQEEAPSAGELPPEFLKEIEGTQMPESVDNAVGDSGGSSSSVPLPPPSESMAPSSGQEMAQPIPTELPQAIEPPPLEGTLPGQSNPMASSSDVEGGGFVYDPTGKRDPFRPHKSAIKLIPKEGALAAAAVEVADPLLKFDLNALEVIGILWDVKKPKAIVKDPDGNTYSVFKNSKIGRADGFVAAIRDGEIVVIETVYEGGKTSREPRIMELKK